ncbi:TlyA family RNA methyltransferase [Hyphobacterium sp.]|uniref:TlyA family RNA methyltransferase n=1 Tax=Hyphobacterium sp. TaxID=2004662 RepID=UPI003BAA018B
MTGSRLDVFLVQSGQFETRARSREAILAGRVSVDGKVVRKPSFRISHGMSVESEALHPYVSRAALKLKGALETFEVSVSGKTCLDIGASTGGFVEVLLEASAKHVIAVDVGKAQLHEKLKRDPRVLSLEQQDARDLDADQFSEAPAIITCDASFIGLAKIIERPLALSAPSSDLIALFKPQFEVGPAHVGKGGLVKDNAAIAAALEVFKAWLDTQTDFHFVAQKDSPITGGDGNREWLIHARKS